MKTLLKVLLFATALLNGCPAPAYAQAAKPAAVAAPAPELHKRPDTVPLSSTEGTAIGALAEKIQANQKKRADLLASIPSTVAQEITANQNERDNLVATVKAIEAEIVAEHPGYHFDENKGTIVKDAAPAPAKVEAKK